MAGEAESNGHAAIVLELDLEGLRLGEIRDFEKAAPSVSFTELGRLIEGDSLPMEATIALVWILRRRVEPELALADVEAMTIGELGAIQYVQAPSNRAERRAAAKRGGPRRPPA